MPINVKSRTGRLLTNTLSYRSTVKNCKQSRHCLARGHSKPCTLKMTNKG